MPNINMPSTWHTGPEDSFHGRITPDGPFKPEKNRYHFYIGLFCPFAHRANIVFHLKQLEKYAGIRTSIVRPYPKGDSKGWPGWRFNAEDGVDNYDGATQDALFASQYLHEIYFKADADYKGRYSVPVLWDTHLDTIVNNESHELLRDLQTAFDDLLPEDVKSMTLYPESLRAKIDQLEPQLQTHLNTGVYKAGFAETQEQYESAIPAVFAMLNKLEQLAARSGGPYLLGKLMTEVDVRAFCTLIRFDVAYVQHFKCNLGMIRYNYPLLHNWLKGLYWNHPDVFKATTDFRHIKENYTKSHYEINPRSITPLGPWPDIEGGYIQDWRSMNPGQIDMPAVNRFELELK